MYLSGYNTNMQLTLEQFINKLTQLKPTAYIEYGFGGLYPTEFDSYRGNYKDLALGFTELYNDVRVEHILKKAKDCIGKTFYGYKGGDFFMYPDTLLWVANWGYTTNTVIVDVLNLDYKAIIITEYNDY